MKKSQAEKVKIYNEICLTSEVIFFICLFLKIPVWPVIVSLFVYSLYVDYTMDYK